MTLHIKTAGSDIAHTDHAANVKGGGVCIYYKKFLPLRVLNIVFLNECINFDSRFGNKTCNFVIFYRSPSQFQDVFESFCQNFANNAQNNPFLLVAKSDVNAKLTRLCAIDQTIKLENNKTESGLSQPKHILDSFSSYIDPIFTCQPNLVTESGAHPSLHQHCHNQIINLQIFTLHHTTEKFETINMGILI